MVNGKKISAMLHKSGKKSYKSGVVIPAKMTFCNECYDKIVCDRCTNQVAKNKHFEANFHLIKRQAPKQFGHMLP